MCDMLIGGCKDNSTPSEKDKLKWLNDNFGKFTSAAFTKEDLGELMRICRGINDYGRSDVDVELDENGAIENVKWEDDDEEPYELREKDDEGEDSGDDAFASFEDPDRKEREKQRGEQANQQLVSNMPVDDDDDVDIVPVNNNETDKREDATNVDRAKREPPTKSNTDNETNESDKSKRMDVDGETVNTNTPDMSLSASKFEISPKEIDAHWLQRKVRQHFKHLDDPLTLSEKLLKALDQSNPRKVEEQLVALVEFSCLYFPHLFFFVFF
ncbi:DEAD/DEAH box helicase [Reticulomyxa filosa]|uniref:DEAD/DEAH box helicase n=1 Tax=Reticulomyxa filosa TaxID=46433 RepID=X6MYH8_RETFI|nr:DEAD/DEAH box helicase [Reticulomyxa filosa]|eukprot:ETO18688.1 DEAD/DEAH box helicase [Reticulomyxa filosa]